MLTAEQLAEIRKRWVDGDMPSGRRIAQAEKDIPALLDTVKELRGLLERAHYVLRPSLVYIMGEGGLILEIKEALK